MTGTMLIVTILIVCYVVYQVISLTRRTNMVLLDFLLWTCLVGTIIVTSISTLKYFKLLA